MTFSENMGRRQAEGGIDSKGGGSWQEASSPRSMREGSFVVYEKVRQNVAVAIASFAARKEQSLPAIGLSRFQLFCLSIIDDVRSGSSVSD